MIRITLSLGRFFAIDSNGALYLSRKSMIPFLGSVMADPTHPEFANRIGIYAAHNVYEHRRRRVDDVLRDGETCFRGLEKGIRL